MRQRSILGAVLAGGLLAGVLDLLFAVSFAAHGGAAPSRVFQTIASGILGNAAFSGGGGVAVFGVACHFGLSFLWAALFAVVAWRCPVVTRRPFLTGVVFGIIVFVCMRLIVLPVSAYPRPVTFQALATVLDLLSHILLFAIPIVLIVGRACRPENSTRSEPLRGSS